MSELLVVRRRPEKSLRKTIESGSSKDEPINKVATTMYKAAEDDISPMAPNDEQLAKINAFTRSPKSADDLVVFPTMSCNDLWDRDDDRFSTKCVIDFAKLEQPYSPIGKAYMVSHDYSKLPVGRIFDVDTKSIEGAKFLTNWVYMPNTPQYQSFIENIDFGVYWAVSVGVVLGTSVCTVGKGHDWGAYPWFCNAGHEKGLYYDPDSEETDSWGWPEPIAETAKNAQFCGRELSEPKDFYELSQCFLGAQYMAELGKDPAFRGIIKAAGAKPINIGFEEAAKLPIPQPPAKLVEAKTKGLEIVEHEDGTSTWADKGLVWCFDPAADEVTCLGEAKPEDPTPKEATMTAEEIKAALDALRQKFEPAKVKAKASEGSGDDEDEDPVDLAQAVDAALDAVQDALDEDNVAEAQDLLTAAEAAVDDLIRVLGGTDEDDPDSSSGKSAVLSINVLIEAGLPADITAEVSKAPEAKRVSVLLEQVTALVAEKDAQIKALETKAAMGESFFKELKDDVLVCYVRAYQESGKKLDTSSAEAIIAAVGENIDALKELRRQYQATAQAKFPTATRRTTFDPEAPDEEELEKEISNIDTSVVSRIHGGVRG